MLIPVHIPLQTFTQKLLVVCSIIATFLFKENKSLSIFFIIFLERNCNKINIDHFQSNPKSDSNYQHNNFKLVLFKDLRMVAINWELLS